MAVSQRFIVFQFNLLSSVPRSSAFCFVQQPCVCAVANIAFARHVYVGISLEGNPARGDRAPSCDARNDGWRAFAASC
jgi:hypothetical protein